jgi:putative hydrolase of the HAD superfamily
VTFQAVVFDLYGTLVPPFPKAEHIKAVEENSAILGLDFEFCHRLWIDSYDRRISGEFGAMTEYFAWFGEQAGVAISSEACTAAALAYAQFARRNIQPLPGVVETLAAIDSCGLQLGLLTNCTPDTAAIFPNTAMGRYFTATVFSSIAKTVKPSPASYARSSPSWGSPRTTSSMSATAATANSPERQRPA